jgi:AP-1 complex subunit sigma 1/2
MLISRQGKIRLTKWYRHYGLKEKARILREVSTMVRARRRPPLQAPLQR